MAYQIPVKYFNSFWLKKVVGDTDLNPKTTIETAITPGTYDYESTVTTTVESGGGNTDDSVSIPYVLPTWPGVPWGSELSKPHPGNGGVQISYPCFPWGGRDWSIYAEDEPLPDCGGSLINSSPSLEEGKERNWAVEEARIRGGYNNTSVDFGVKAYAVEDENLAEHRFNTLIYSGIYNSQTGINNTNVFSTAEGSIVKSLDPSNGSIQKLYAYDTNLTIFQENKVSKALIDKDAIYSAEGQGTPVSSTKIVIGQIVPYVGEYGISKNPESWAQFGFRQYFADKYRNAIMRLSRDGLTEISSYGLDDYFRDTLSTVSENPVSTTLAYAYVDEGLLPTEFINFAIIENNLNCDCSNIRIGSLVSINGTTLPGLFVTSVFDAANCTLGLSKPWTPSQFGLADWPEQINFVFTNKDVVQGGHDNYNKNYVVSVQTYERTSSCVPRIIYNTVNFDEGINGWVSFYDYMPTVMESLKNNYYSVDKWKLYRHYSGNVYGNFYGQQYSSSIEFIFNPKPSTVKNFQTVSYEGTNGWEVDHFVSDTTEEIYNVFSGSYMASNDITNKVLSLQEGKYTDVNTGYEEYAGFKLKENKYVANLINNTAAFIDEVDFTTGAVNGSSMSGIKGYFATVQLSTDNTTDVGGVKELYAVSSKWVVSSQ